MNLGDSIEDVNDKKIDIQSFKQIHGILSNLNMSTHWLIGNHDVRTLTEKEIAEMLGYERMYYSFDFDLYHFIALSFKMTGNYRQDLSDITARVPDEQIEWLKTDLTKTEKPAVIFIHYGLAEDDMKGNFWFDSEAYYALIENREQIRKILEDSKKVKAVISAHQHWNKMHVCNGIAYFVVTSLTENFKNDGIASKAYTIVNLDNNTINVNVKGNDPAQFKHSF